MCTTSAANTTLYSKNDLVLRSGAHDDIEDGVAALLAVHTLHNACLKFVREDYSTNSRRQPILTSDVPCERAGAGGQCISSTRAR